MSNSNQSIVCNLCNFICSKKCDWERHILTRKHAINHTIKNIPIATPKIIHKCLHCPKTYADYKGLWRHKKKCKANERPTNNNDENITVELNNTECSQYENIFMSISPAQESIQESIQEPYQESTYESSSDDDDNTHITNEMMCEILKELCISNAQNTELNKQNIELQKQNAEFQAKFFEFMKENKFSNITNNVQINIDTFLNDCCKEAPSMNDFTKNIKVSVEEMFYIGKKGYKEGLIFILDRILSNIRLGERPFHCTDPKRHTTYVKNDTGWTKTHDQKPLLKLCDGIGSKCNSTFFEFSNEYPNYRTAGMPEFEIGVDIVVQSHGGKCGGADQYNMSVANYVENKYHLDKEQMKTAIMNT